MPSRIHKLVNWAFDKPLRSAALHRLARAYNRVYTNGVIDRVDIQTNGELHLLARVARGVSVAFDVGANVGDWTEELLKFNAAADVHAFEPVSSTRKVFEEKAFPPSVHLCPFGLSDHATEQTIYDYGNDGGMNSIYRRTDLESRNSALRPSTEQIDLQTLDAYADEKSIERIDFLKIDVEGHELSVLRGAARMLAENRIGIIQLEYGTSFHYANVLLRDIFDAVRPAGMIGGLIRPDQIIRHDTYHSRLETFALCNWVFASPDHPDVWQTDVGD